MEAWKQFNVEVLYEEFNKQSFNMLKINKLTQIKVRHKCNQNFFHQLFSLFYKLID
jgi:hypothetical protein